MREPHSVESSLNCLAGAVQIQYVSALVEFVGKMLAYILSYISKQEKSKKY